MKRDDIQPGITFIVLYQNPEDGHNVDYHAILSSGPTPREMVERMTYFGLSCYDIEDAEIYIIGKKFELPQELIDELLEKSNREFREEMEYHKQRRERTQKG